MLEYLVDDHLASEAFTRESSMPVGRKAHRRAEDDTASGMDTKIRRKNIDGIGLGVRGRREYISYTVPSLAPYVNANLEFLRLCAATAVAHHHLVRCHCLVFCCGFCFFIHQRHYLTHTHLCNHSIGLHSFRCFFSSGCFSLRKKSRGPVLFFNPPAGPLQPPRTSTHL